MGEETAFNPDGNCEEQDAADIKWSREATDHRADPQSRRNSLITEIIRGGLIRAHRVTGSSCMSRDCRRWTGHLHLSLPLERPMAVF
jgi:hypothetical protein